MWPTSQATLAPSPPLLSLRMDTIWPQVRTTDSHFTQCSCWSLMCKWSTPGCKCPRTLKMLEIAHTHNLHTDLQDLQILRASSALDFALKGSGPVYLIVLKYTNIVWCCTSGAQDSSLKLWDLRKLKNFKTITLDNNYEVRNCGYFSYNRNSLKFM